MATRLNTELQNIMADAMAGQFDGGMLEIYDGSQPASADDSPGSTLLGTMNLPSPAFKAATGGTATKNGTWDVAIDQGGTAGWFRMRAADTSTAAAKDGNITADGGGGELELSKTDLYAGDIVEVTKAEITQPSGE